MSLKEITRFASNAKEPIAVPVILDAKIFFIRDKFQTACGTFELKAPLKSLSKKSFVLRLQNGWEEYPRSSSTVRLSLALWNSRAYPRVGTLPPISIDALHGRMNFRYYLELEKELWPRLKWWKEVTQRYGVYQTQAPFLLVESTPEGLRFNSDLTDYRPTPVHEVPGTVEELRRMPFSRVFQYSGGQRVQVPASCR
jgi:hypothetical protein